MTLTLGAQPARDISQCLLAADFGVSPVPPEYLSKSGTAAAMLDHGLPVIVTREPYLYRNCPAGLLDPGLKNVVRDFDLDSTRKTEPPLSPRGNRRAIRRRSAGRRIAMKIFLTSYLFAPSIGGIETVSMLLAREFIAAGHEGARGHDHPGRGGHRLRLRDRAPAHFRAGQGAPAMVRRLFPEQHQPRARAPRCCSCDGPGSSFITPGFPFHGASPA